MNQEHRIIHDACNSHKLNFHKYEIDIFDNFD